MAGEIVVGYDGSAGAKVALEEAARLARDTGASVVVTYGYGVWVVGGETGDHMAAVHRIGEEATGEALARLAELGVPGEAVVVPDRPWGALLRVAEEREARMIVVGTRGEGPVIGTLLGSVPYKLLPQTSVPVLVVPVREA